MPAISTTSRAASKIVCSCVSIEPAILLHRRRQMERRRHVDDPDLAQLLLDRRALAVQLVGPLHPPLRREILDREVEREAGTSMNEILLLHGQAGYRRYERRALLRIAEEHPEGVVMTTGGSIVSERETFDLLQSHFYCVWLKASPEEHMSRVVAQGDMRPFDAGDNAKGGATREALDDIRRILASREALYARADAVVDTAARTVKQSLKDLERAVPKETT